MKPNDASSNPPRRVCLPDGTWATTPLTPEQQEMSREAIEKQLAAHREDFRKNPPRRLLEGLRDALRNGEEVPDRWKPFLPQWMPLLQRLDE